jgi:RNA polymerase sigma-70 factor (ECF subfamily)
MDETIQHKIDNVMLSCLAEGDEKVFAKFVHIIYKKLFPFTVSLIKSEAEADDILQEVFVKVWLHRTSFATMENHIGWIFKVAANIASNHLRAKLRRERREKQQDIQMVAAEEIEESIDAKFVQELVDEAVDCLPEKRRIIFLLSKKEGLSRKEIAHRLHISENTVRNQLSEAVKFIHRYLGQKGNPLIAFLFALQYIFNTFF